MMAAILCNLTYWELNIIDTDDSATYTEINTSDSDSWTEISTSDSDTWTQLRGC